MNCAAQPFRWHQQEELEMNPKRSKSRHGRKMPMVHPNAAAIDVGATMHMAAVRADRTPEPVRSFGTFTADLHRLVDWFTQCGVETVVMESTSVYWIPVFELLDARGFTVFLVNARDAKHVPGRKTDVSDAQWLQRLHSYGLLRASFRPKGQIAELRSYVRQRERLLEYAASHIQHMQKALTEMNLQLHHVVADITGATGLRIIRAILAGERDPEALAALRHYSCHSSAETIAKALTGSYRAEHLFALEQALALYTAYREKASACDVRIEAVLKELSIHRGRDHGAVPPPRRRHRTDQVNALAFDVRSVDQRRHADRVEALAGQQHEAHKIAERIGQRQDFGRHAAFGAADGLALSPPFAPWPWRWTLTMVASTMAYSMSGSSEQAANSRANTSALTQSRKRLKTVFHLPKKAGRSRHGLLVRTIQSTASTKRRLSLPLRPGSLGLPRQCGSIFAHWASVSTNRSIQSLNHNLASGGIPNLNRP